MIRLRRGGQPRRRRRGSRARPGRRRRNRPARLGRTRAGRQAQRWRGRLDASARPLRCGTRAAARHRVGRPPVAPEFRRRRRESRSRRRGRDSAPRSGASPTRGRHRASQGGHGALPASGRAATPCPPPHFGLTSPHPRPRKLARRAPFAMRARSSFDAPAASAWLGGSLSARRPSQSARRRRRGGRVP